MDPVRIRRGREGIIGGEGEQDGPARPVNLPARLAGKGQPAPGETDDPHGGITVSVAEHHDNVSVIERLRTGHENPAASGIPRLDTHQEVPVGRGGNQGVRHPFSDDPVGYLQGLAGLDGRFFRHIKDQFYRPVARNDQVRTVGED